MGEMSLRLERSARLNGQAGLTQSLEVGLGLGPERFQERKELDRGLGSECRRCAVRTAGTLSCRERRDLPVSGHRRRQGLSFLGEELALI